MSFWGPQCCETASNAKPEKEPNLFDGVFDFFVKCSNPSAEGQRGGQRNGIHSEIYSRPVSSAYTAAPVEFNLDDRSLEQLFRRADMNRTGYIERDEAKFMFQEVMNYIDSAYQPSSEDFEDLFAYFDRDRDGRIDRVDHRLSMRELLTKYRFGEQALIIVDLQNDFVCGTLKVEGGLDAVRNTNSIRKRFKHVFCTRDWHPKNHCSFHENNPNTNLFDTIKMRLPDGEIVNQVMWPTHCVQHSSGAEFHPELVRKPDDVVVDKGLNVAVDSYSGFFDNGSGRNGDTGMLELLHQHNVNEVYVVGLAYDFCVGFTAKDAVDCGFKSYLVEDCARAVQPATKRDMRQSLIDKGVKLIHSSMAPLSRPCPNGTYTMQAVRRATMQRG
mmetsp:Transcript_51912/g.105698  ORF Transcript_51912/g.105698 Transcript_51912/m.105698 type:complete len:385 (+) Transcript_51912:163-1317(+)|eukprot:CAMPEP_0181309050 /NCGR_PEP_ID=MMETSP1101-20121128/11806_1 /TAXON_ID=46948 /ORGANISM="Rhodomonas abbreviata, Strain Caron Lab Isolate" /LENGTH=384 /DNA_ID=CAMNT_0023415507 /DNA_START=129 /DNA_END=1283 /DNA_ORIENTATION=-